MKAKLVRHIYNTKKNRTEVEPHVHRVVSGCGSKGTFMRPHWACRATLGFYSNGENHWSEEWKIFFIIIIIIIIII